MEAPASQVATAFRASHDESAYLRLVRTGLWHSFAVAISCGFLGVLAPMAAGWPSLGIPTPTAPIAHPFPNCLRTPKQPFQSASLIKDLLKHY
mgnify:CR=1 FL=1